MRVVSEDATYESVTLQTLPLPRLVPDGVFDAFGWCASSTLEWRRPAPGHLPRGAPIDGANPPGLAFVFREGGADFLPRELARLHVPRLANEGEWALAPYAIDDATDQLYAHRIEPARALLLAAGSLTALVWGLHDWAHFHNYGPFEQRALTELQCDASALVWLHANASVIGLVHEEWDVLRRELIELSARRFAEENLAFDRSVLSESSLRGRP